MKIPTIEDLSLVFFDPSKAKVVLEMQQEDVLKITEENGYLFDSPETARLQILGSLEGWYGTCYYGVDVIIHNDLTIAECVCTGSDYDDTLIYFSGDYVVMSIKEFKEMLT